MKHLLSVTIITLNEEKNIYRCLKSLEEISNDIIIVDSGSTDKTVEIARQFKHVSIYVNSWKGYGIQKNFAHSKAKNEWILNIDADESLSKELYEEIKLLFLEQNTLKDYNGFSIPRLTHYLGKDIKHGGWYPNRLVRLSKKMSSKWTEPSIHEELIVEGNVKKLNSNLMHYSFNSIEDQVLTNIKYAKLGTDSLIKKNKKFSLLRALLKPIGKFIETYFIKKGILDGIPGLIISINASYSIFLKHINLYRINEHKIKD